MMHLARAAAAGLTTVVALATMTACGGSDGSASSTSTPSGETTSAGVDTAAPSDTSSVTSSDTASAPSTSSTSAGSSADAAAFCQTFTAIPTGLNGDDPDAVADAAHTFGQQLGSAGVPSDMPSDAQAGLQAYVKVLEDLQPADVPKLAGATDPTQLFGDDSDNVEAFFTYIAKDCADELGSLSGSASASAAAPSTTP